MAILDWIEVSGKPSPDGITAMVILRIGGGPESCREAHDVIVGDGRTDIQ
jgi:hypothetical protein